jgi:hypothetical protein
VAFDGLPAHEQSAEVLARCAAVRDSDRHVAGYFLRLSGKASCPARAACSTGNWLTECLGRYLFTGK